MILKLKELLLKIQKLHNKQTSNLRNSHTRTHARTHARTQLKLNDDLFLRGHWGKEDAAGPARKF